MSFLTMSTESASRNQETTGGAATAGDGSTPPTMQEILDLCNKSTISTGESPRERVQPLWAAQKYFDRHFVCSLQFKEQRSVFTELGGRYLMSFASFYNASKAILKASSDSAYCPPNCTVKWNFQPVKSIEEGAAYKALSTKVDAAIKQFRVQLGKHYVSGLQLNKTAHKNQLVKDMAQALPRWAELLLVEADASKYDKHDLVADLLQAHWTEILSDKCSLAHFVEVYKQINNCGRPTTNWQFVHKQLFPDVPCTPAETRGSPKAPDTPTQLTPANSITQESQTPGAKENSPTALGETPITHLTRSQLRELVNKASTALGAIGGNENSETAGQLQLLLKGLPERSPKRSATTHSSLHSRAISQSSSSRESSTKNCQQKASAKHQPPSEIEVENPPDFDYGISDGELISSALEVERRTKCQNLAYVNSIRSTPKYNLTPPTTYRPQVLTTPRQPGQTKPQARSSPP